MAVWQTGIVAHGRVLYLRAGLAPGAVGSVGPYAYQHQTAPALVDAAAGQTLVKDLDGTAGFAFGRGATPDYAGWALVVPLWFPALVLAIPPAAWVLAWRRRRLARRTGLCTECGYALRATPERCPECGREAGKDAR